MTARKRRQDIHEGDGSLYIIASNNGRIIRFDQRDRAIVEEFTWSAMRVGTLANGDGIWYAVTTFRAEHGERSGPRQYMHILINPPLRDGREWDHIDHDGLNNKRSNLRAVTHTENMWNQRNSKRCRNCGKPPKRVMSQNLCENCYMRAWRKGEITVRPRGSDPLTLPRVRLRGAPVVNGACCLILKSAYERGRYGRDAYSATLDPDLGHTGIHRVSFYRANGWLPDGYKDVIRHRCDRPGCFEERHLFAGPQRDNVVLDSTTSIPSINARKTHCVNGHEFTPENTYMHRGSRSCRECRRQQVREWQRRKRHPTYQC